MKYIYMIAIEDGKHYEGPEFYAEAYFDTEDPDLIEKVKNHLTKEMSYKGSLEILKNISKDNFENIIINLRNDYYADIIVLK